MSHDLESQKVHLGPSFMKAIYWLQYTGVSANIQFRYRECFVQKILSRNMGRFFLFEMILQFSSNWYIHFIDIFPSSPQRDDYHQVQGIPFSSDAISTHRRQNMDVPYVSNSSQVATYSPDRHINYNEVKTEKTTLPVKENISIDTLETHENEKRTNSSTICTDKSNIRLLLQEGPFNNKLSNNPENTSAKVSSSTSLGGEEDEEFHFPKDSRFSPDDEDDSQPIINAPSDPNPKIFETNNNVYPPNEKKANDSPVLKSQELDSVNTNSLKVGTPEENLPIANSPKLGQDKLEARKKNPLKENSPNKSPLKENSPNKSSLNENSPKKSPLEEISSKKKGPLEEISPNKTPLKENSPKKSSLNENSPNRSPLEEISPNRSKLEELSPNKTPLISPKKKSPLKEISPNISPQKDNIPKLNTPKEESLNENSPKLDASKESPLKSRSPNQTSQNVEALKESSPKKNTPNVVSENERPRKKNSTQKNPTNEHLNSTSTDTTPQIANSTEVNTNSETPQNISELKATNDFLENMHDAHTTMLEIASSVDNPETRGSITFIAKTIHDSFLSEKSPQKRHACTDSCEGHTPPRSLKQYMNYERKSVPISFDIPVRHDKQHQEGDTNASSKSDEESPIRMRSKNLREQKYLAKKESEINKTANEANKKVSNGQNKDVFDEMTCWTNPQSVRLPGNQTPESHVTQPTLVLSETSNGASGGVQTDASSDVQTDVSGGVQTDASSGVQTIPVAAITNRQFSTFYLQLNALYEMILQAPFPTNPEHEAILRRATNVYYKKLRETYDESPILVNHNLPTYGLNYNPAAANHPTFFPNPCYQANTQEASAKNTSQTPEHILSSSTSQDCSGRQPEAKSGTIILGAESQSQDSEDAHMIAELHDCMKVHPNIVTALCDSMSDEAQTTNTKFFPSLSDEDDSSVQMEVTQIAPGGKGQNGSNKSICSRMKLADQKDHTKRHQDEGLKRTVRDRINDSTQSCEMSSGNFTHSEEESSSKGCRENGVKKEEKVPKEPACVVCGIFGLIRLFECDKCNNKTVTYCSRFCQNKHWRVHEFDCGNRVRFDLMKLLIPPKMKRRFDLDCLEFIHVFTSCPDVLSKDGYRVAMLVRIYEKIETTNGSTFAFSVVDYEGELSILHFHLPLDTIYYFPKKEHGEQKSRLLRNLLNEGVFLILFDIHWCMFRDAPGFRVDDMRDMFVLPDIDSPEGYTELLKESELKRSSSTDKIDAPVKLPKEIGKSARSDKATRRDNERNKKYGNSEKAPISKSLTIEDRKSPDGSEAKGNDKNTSKNQNLTCNENDKSNRNKNTSEGDKSSGMNEALKKNTNSKGWKSRDEKKAKKSKKSKW